MYENFLLITHCVMPECINVCSNWTLSLLKCFTLHFCNAVRGVTKRGAPAPGAKILGGGKFGENKTRPLLIIFATWPEMLLPAAHYVI